MPITCDIIASHPDASGRAGDALIRCIEECYACAQACTACADACLAGDGVAGLRRRIRLDLDCADVCAATGAVASRRIGSDETEVQAMLRSCEIACSLCAAECEGHAGHHTHCRMCAEACRRCEAACR